MNTVEILKMPEINFAHSFETDRKFTNSFGQRRDFIEICYIYDGQLTVKKGSESYVVQKGDIQCLIHDEPTTVEANERHRHHTIGISTEWIFSESSHGLYLPILTKSCKETEEIQKLIDDAIYAPYKFENSPTKTANHILKILCKIDEINRRNQTSEYSVLVERAKKYIQKNIYKAVTQTEVAEHLGISTGYLCHVFRQSEGTTLMKYVNTLKLKNIEKIMEKEKIKLYKAAEMYGYNDANYVSSLYKKMFGKNITEHYNSILKEPK